MNKISPTHLHSIPTKLIVCSHHGLSSPGTWSQRAKRAFGQQCFHCLVVDIICAFSYLSCPAPHCLSILWSSNHHLFSGSWTPSILPVPDCLPGPEPSHFVLPAGNCVLLAHGASSTSLPVEEGLFLPLSSFHANLCHPFLAPSLTFKRGRVANLTDQHSKSFFMSHFLWDQITVC